MTNVASNSVAAKPAAAAETRQIVLKDMRPFGAWAACSLDLIPCHNPNGLDGHEHL